MAAKMLEVGWVLFWIFRANGQSCLQGADGKPPPFFDNNRNDILPSDTQAIVTSYMFQCCVNITKWETFVQPGGRGHSTGVYIITFQVWRPSSNIGESVCHTLVGYNQFNGTVQNGGKVELTLKPSEYIEAQPGDVVGFYVHSNNGGREGIQMERTSLNRVWYHTRSAGDYLIHINNACPFPIGRTGTLRNLSQAAPIVRVHTSGMCPTKVSPETLLPPISKVTSEAITVTSTSARATPTTTATNPMNIDISGNNTLTNAMLTSTSVPGRDMISTIVIGVSVSVVAVTAIIVAAMMIGIVVWKKRKARKCPQPASSMDRLDLANPNYDMTPVCNVQVIESPGNKKNKIMPSKPPHILPPLPMGNYDFGATYESLECGELTPYSFPQSPSTDAEGPSFNNYTYITVGTPTGGRCSSRNYVYAMEEDLYHVIGPDAGFPPGSGDKQSDKVLPPPVPRRNDDDNLNFKRFYHILEGGINSATSIVNPIAIYEDPTTTRFRTQDVNQDRMTFETTGYYVPTEEERSENHGYEQAYEQEYGYKPINRSKCLNFFVEDQIYWAPAATAPALYAQLSSKRYREIPRNQLILRELLGAGQFGEVHKAVWRVESQELELAVKTLKSGASEDDKVKFLQEAAIMGQFSHTNVIKMYGVVTVGEPVMICSEILANGDLRSYLQSLVLNGSKHSDFEEAQQMFLKFARDVAAGMEYLSQKSFVHRDLAARNILLNKFLTCKVADFGMARDLMDDTYYKSSGGKIPVKWTAPEALLYKKFSTDSDVWSYGMVLFEIWSVAKKPFSDITNNQVLRLIQTGYCQPPPPGCPRSIYQLMVECWNPNHQSRPNFNTIFQNYLKKPSVILLNWTQEEGVSQAAGVCGAPLHEAHKLHMDLQLKYKNYRML